MKTNEYNAYVKRNHLAVNENQTREIVIVDLLVLPFLKSKSTGTKATVATFARSAKQRLCTIYYNMNGIARSASVCSNSKKHGLITSFLVLNQSKYISNLQVSKTFHVPNPAVATIKQTD